MPLRTGSLLPRARFPPPSSRAGNTPTGPLQPTIFLPHPVGNASITILVYNGDMPASNKTVRQSIGLPRDTARKVQSLAKQRRLSANRIIVELVEKGMEAQKNK